MTCHLGTAIAFHLCKLRYYSPESWNSELSSSHHSWGKIRRKAWQGGREGGRGGREGGREGEREGGREEREGKKEQRRVICSTCSC